MIQNYKMSEEKATVLCLEFEEKGIFRYIGDKDGERNYKLMGGIEEQIEIRMGIIYDLNQDFDSALMTCINAFLFDTFNFSDSITVDEMNEYTWLFTFMLIKSSPLGKRYFLDFDNLIHKYFVNQEKHKNDS